MGIAGGWWLKSGDICYAGEKCEGRGRGRGAKCLPIALLAGTTTSACGRTPQARFDETHKTHTHTRQVGRSHPRHSLHRLVSKTIENWFSSLTQLAAGLVASLSTKQSRAVRAAAVMQRYGGAVDGGGRPKLVKREFKGGHGPK